MASNSNQLKDFVKRAEARGFNATQITARRFEFQKDGWTIFQVKGLKPSGYGFIIPEPNRNSNQPLQVWIDTLETYLNGKVFVPTGDDVTELGEYLREYHRKGYDVIEVGPRHYYVKAPNLLAMMHVWEKPNTMDLKIEVLKQLA